MIEFPERAFIEASDQELNDMIIRLLIDIDPEHDVMWTDVADKDVELFEELMYERILRN